VGTAASKEKQLTDIFREVDEDLKRDKLGDLWAKYGGVLIGAAALFVIIVAGSIAWGNYQETKQESLSDEFAQAEKLALEGKSAEAALAYDALATKTASGYKTLALFQKASLLVGDGKLQEAADLYDEIATRGTGDKILRDLAKLKAGWALADTASLADLQARLADMAAGQGPWQKSAQEVLSYAAFRAGDIDVARIGYGGLANDPATPQGIAQRASAMLSIIGPIAPQTPVGQAASGDAPAATDSPVEEATDETTPAETTPAETTPAETTTADETIDETP
jgi:hypothetical protein